MRTIRRLHRLQLEQALSLSLDLFSKYGEDLFPVDATRSRAYLNAALADKNSYLRGMFDGDQLVGWMHAAPGHGHHHSIITGMSQVYYHSSLTGVKALNALVEFHQDFFDYVEGRGLQIAVSSSTLPNAELFCRLLERAEWSRAGEGRMARPTKFHPLRSEVAHGGRSGTRVLSARGGAS